MEYSKSSAPDATEAAKLVASYTGQEMTKEVIGRINEIGITQGRRMLLGSYKEMACIE